MKAALKRLMSDALATRGYRLAKIADVHALKDHLRFVFADLRVDCVIDVGAHRGDYGSWLRSIGYAGPIVSFEPVSGTYAELARHAAADPRWSAHRMALGSGEETREIGVAGSTDFSSFRSFTPFAGEAFPTQTRIAHREEVSIRRLDAVLDEVVPAGAQRLFLKLDTQGWDIEALEGASGCLDRVVALQLEASARSLYDGMPSYLEALGYATRVGFTLTDVVPIVRDRRNRVIEYDCVLCRDS